MSMASKYLNYPLPELEIQREMTMSGFVAYAHPAQTLRYPVRNCAKHPAWNWER